MIKVYGNIAGGRTVSVIHGVEKISFAKYWVYYNQRR